MNIPIDILSRSFRLILAEPLRTLTVIAPGAALYMVAAFLAYMGFETGGGADGSDLILSYPLVGGAIVVVMLAWMCFAILWHRHALLEGDRRAHVMRPGRAVFGQYFKCALMITLILFALAFGGAVLVIFGAFALLAATGPVIGEYATMGISLLFIVALSWILLRISLILLAAATGQVMSFGESWQATRPISRDIFWIAILLAFMSAVVEQLAAGLATAVPSAALFFQVASDAIQALIYVSVLSTLYGHLIQGRSLT
ncbi:hypothetical protein [Roseobacter sp.]|uniref:hypothetical protein n=1 Tax=Roseobacter sp. TaxID=1907202 RepID=UPI00385AF99B